MPKIGQLGFCHELEALHTSFLSSLDCSLQVIMYIRISIRKTDPKQKKSVFASTATAIVFFDQHSFHAKLLLLFVSLIDVPMPRDFG